MENNETKACAIKDFCKAKPTLVIIVACLLCFFIGFGLGNVAGKSAQRKADARIIAAANARANAARTRRIGNIARPNNIRPRVNPQTARRVNVANRPSVNRPSVNRPAATVNRAAVNRSQSK